MGDKRPLSAKLHKAVNELFDQGIHNTAEVVDRLNGKINAQQVGGLLTLWKRRANGTAGFNTPRREPEIRPTTASAPRVEERIETPGGTAPLPSPEAAAGSAAKPAAAAVPPTDAFDFGTAPSAADSASLGFGQPLVEYHLRRLGPSLAGFLGVEGDPINEDIIGRKHGGGDYEITKYQNGNRYGYPVRRKISEASYGPPKNARAASSYPRLRSGGEDDPAAEPTETRRRQGGSGELNDTVQAFRAINDIVKENKDAARPETSTAESKIVDKALEIVTGKGGGNGGSTDLILTFYQQQEAKREAEARDAKAVWQRDQDAREADFKRQQKIEDDRRAADLAEMKARHEQETTRIRQEHADRDKRDKDYRDFVEKLENDRQKRLDKVIEETQGQIAAVQASVAEEAKKEREHQQELGKAKDETLKIERERLQAEIKMQRESNDRLFEFQKTTNSQMYDLQLKSSGNGVDKGTEMIVGVIKDGLGKADARAHEITEYKKLEKLIATVGPENAKALAMQLLAGGGGIDLGSILGGGRRGGAAPPAGNGSAAEPEGAHNGQNGAAPAAPPQGGIMNAIAQQTIDSPFFKDLLEIWGNHLRKRNSPFLFADVMAGFMLDDRRVALFYNWMAGEDWPDMLKAIKPKIKAEQTAHFEAPEAAVFFNAFVEIIAKRIERDHVQGGIVPTGAAQTEAPAQ